MNALSPSLDLAPALVVLPGPRAAAADAAEAKALAPPYARALFDRYGLFREDIEGGEDTEFNGRLTGADRPVWRPEVLTTHCGVTHLGPFLAGQARRGRRMAESSQAIGRADASGVARNVLRRTGHMRRLSRLAMKGEHPVSRFFAIPLIWLGNIAYAWGAWKAGLKP